MAAFVSYFRENRFDLSFMLNGALGGLVAITAEPLYPDPLAALAIGMFAGLILFWSIQFLEYMEIDDVVGAIPVHLFCGVWGTVAVAFSNPDATFLGQIGSVVIVMLYVAATTSMVWYTLKTTMGLRVQSNVEESGIDEANYVMSS